MTPSNQKLIPAYKMRHVRVAVPDEISADELDANMRSVAREMFENGAVTIDVEAHEGEAPFATTKAAVGTLIFSPDQPWAQPGYDYKISEYRTMIWRSR